MTATLTADLPPATALPYATATATQQALALTFLRRELAQHFPTLPVTAWERVLAHQQPALWVLDNGEVELDWQDVVLLTQLLAASPELPHLDPPIHSHYTHYLARRLQGFGQQAVQALAEVEVHPAGVGPRTVALLSALATGNATAEHILTAFAAEGRPVPADEQPGSPAVLSRLRALARARGLPV